LPTVVFDTPVNREILGDDALYAKYGDVAELAGAIGRLAGDRELREELAVAGRQRALREHSWEARGKQLMQIYKQIARVKE
jgi:glycosyltransferase involved in cell wall biosynthesis